jgi:peptidyl-prolyl cis-trans isomerase B (cyclophilin B)
MANKRARDRQLAKLAARRQAERRDRQRRRARIVGGVTGLLVIGLAVAGFVALTSDDGTQAQPSDTPTVSPPAGPSPKPTETGTVSNKADIPADVACGAEAPKDAASDKPQYSNAPPQQIDAAKTYTATISTSCGDIVVKLDPAGAPIGVNNFVFLTRKGFYDGLWFHRDAPDFVIQGGDPEGTGGGGPGYAFTTETNGRLTFADNGYLIAYANSGPDTNGSQFFITIGEQGALDPPNGPYTAFGEVAKGQDVVDTINGLKTTQNPGIQGEKSQPLEAVYIESVTIDEQKKG